MDELVVAHVSQSRGQKSDALDALARAEELRTGAIKRPVFKAPGQLSRLRELACVPSMPVGDVVRVRLPLKAMYRSRGVPTTGNAVDSPKGREAWLKNLPVSRKHSIARVLQAAPDMGPIPVACLLPIVVTPTRVRTRRRFRSYCRLGVVMRSSSDWIPTAAGGRGQRKAPLSDAASARTHGAVVPPR